MFKNAPQMVPTGTKLISKWYPDVTEWRQRSPEMIFDQNWLHFGVKMGANMMPNMDQNNSDFHIAFVNTLGGYFCCKFN